MSDTESDIKQKSRIKRAKAALSTLAAKSKFWAVATLVVSIIILAVYLVPVGFILASPNSPAQFRSAFLLFIGGLAISGISIYIDEEVFDYTVALIAFILSIIPGIVGTVFELVRISYCTGVSTPSVTPLENDICINWPGQAYLIPVISAVFILLIVAMAISVFFWVRRFNMKLSAKAIALGRSVRADLNQARELKFKYALASYAHITCMVIAVILFILVLVVVVAQCVYPSAAAFYRATFLFPTVLLLASEWAFFGTTPRGWLWAVLVFGVFSSITTIWGSVYEMARVVACLNGAPVGTTDNQICTQEPGISNIVPAILLSSAILSVISVIALILGVLGEYCWNSDTKAKKTKKANEDDF